MNEKSYAWWEGMFTGKYFFRPEESPVASYRFAESEDAFEVDAEAASDNWIYLPSKSVCPISYALEFDYTVFQAMRETLQLCFSFDSLASRLRFVLGYNRTLSFEVVESGMFLSAYEREKLWDRLTKPCSLTTSANPKHEPLICEARRRSPFPNQMLALVDRMWVGHIGGDGALRETRFR